MKTNKSVECRVPSVESRAAGAGSSRHPSPVTRHVPAFTLIELLVVIAVIAAIAALILPVAGAVKRRAFIQTAQSEMSQLETAIERYHSAYGFYPPNSQYGPLTNQLYYELVGTTNVAAPSAAPIYEPLGNPAHQLTGAQVNTAFGVTGFMNCNKPNADESAQRAENFLPDLKPNQIGAVPFSGFAISNLVTAVGGPDPTYLPLGAIDVNPWRYVAPGINNPGSYDLWVQLKISGKTNLICNWSSQVQVNNPLP